jgi:hypothetical protein
MIKNYPVNTLQDRLTTRDYFIGSKPPNYEDLATLEKNKPSLQQAQYYTNSLSGGCGHRLEKLSGLLLLATGPGGYSDW